MLRAVGRIFNWGLRKESERDRSSRGRKRGGERKDREVRRESDRVCGEDK
jgi:hypothetical protein